MSRSCHPERAQRAKDLLSLLFCLIAAFTARPANAQAPNLDWRTIRTKHFYVHFNPNTEPLARLVQAGMMREMGLRDSGVHYQNIAIGRTMWMPSLICEGAFLMVPEQENAVKTPEFQDRYARGVADGIEAYFRSLIR